MSTKANILFILSNNKQLGDTGKDTGFHLEEVAVPYFLLKNKGFDINFASPQGGNLPVDPNSVEEKSDQGHAFEKDDEAQARVKNSSKLSDVSIDNYDGIYIPGGHGLCWQLPEDKSSIAIIEAAAKAGKPIAAVCHGPWALRNVKVKGEYLLKGVKYTSFTDAEETECELQEVVPFSMEKDAKAMDAKYVKKDKWADHCVVDKAACGSTIITGQNPKSAKSLAEALVSALGK